MSLDHLLIEISLLVALRVWATSTPQMDAFYGSTTSSSHRSSLAPDAQHAFSGQPLNQSPRPNINIAIFVLPEQPASSSSNSPRSAAPGPAAIRRPVRLYGIDGEDGSRSFIGGSSTCLIVNVLTFVKALLSLFCLCLFCFFSPWSLPR
jgi:hypothetical protein